MKPPSADPGGHHVIVSGRQVLTAARVRTWVQEGVGFRVDKPRRFTRQIYLHWTAGENLAPQVVANMTTKRTSVHFIVEPDGWALQACDADRLCAHAKGFNEESIGIEVVCRGDDAHVKDKLVKRRDVTEMVHGKHVRYGDFTDAQKATVLDLVETLCRAYHLPMVVPLDERGEVVSRMLSTTFLARWHGVLGHYHTRVDKRDPAPGLLKLVSDRGRERGLG